MPHRLLYIVIILLLTVSCFAGNPLLRGTWKGYITSKSLDKDNKDGLPTTLTIIDDNNAGQVVGEMTVQYRYQTDIYKAKYAIQGELNYQKFSISFTQTRLIYSDLLPKGLNWCFGSATLKIFRSTYKKKIYMDGYMNSNCGKEKMRVILVRQ